MIGINGEKLQRVVSHWKTRRQPHDPYFDSVLGLCASALPKQDFAPFVSSTGSKSINCTSSDVGRQRRLSRILQEMLLFGTRRGGGEKSTTLHHNHHREHILCRVRACDVPTFHCAEPRMQAPRLFVTGCFLLSDQTFSDSRPRLHSNEQNRLPDK